MTKETCMLTKTNKLVDLNGDFTNFETTFSCRSTDGKDFEFLVLDQTKLDSETLDFKKTNGGAVAATVKSETNIYQNHFLVLKCTNPTEVNIEYNVRELPKVVESRQDQRQDQRQDSIQDSIQDQRQDQSMEAYSQPSQHSSSIKWYIVIGLIVIVAAFLFFKRKNGSGSSDAKVDIVETLSSSIPTSIPTSITTSIPTPMSIPTPEIKPQSDFSLGRRINERLIEKLKQSNRYM